MTGQGTDPGSFRDPSGFVYHRGGRVLRQVNAVYREEYDALLSSGLYRELVDDALLVPHREIAPDASASRDCYKLLEPEKVSFISYPYEWCCSQLRDAALATLAVQKRALARGMTLKDASAYNMQFRGGKPVHIDTLSFERWREGSPWVAYRQFCQHFLAPLALMSRVDARCSQLLRVHIDGIPLDLASRLLPGRTRFSVPLQLHLHLHARAQEKYRAAPSAPTGLKMTLRNLQAFVESLEAAVRSLKPPDPRSGWSGYYEMDSYSPVGLQSKRSTVAGYLERTAPAAVWDLGSNTGMFSRLASARAAVTLSIDSDHDAVEANYREVRRTGEANILPLWIDLVNPSGGIGWNNRERLPLADRGRPDMVFALALLHHLAISQNVPLGMIAEFLAGLTRRWLAVEFVPKSDPKTQLLLSSRVDIFPSYSREEFERAFQERFSIEAVDPVEDSQRVLYLMQARA